MRTHFLNSRKKWIASAVICSVLAGGCASKQTEIPVLIEPVSPGIATAEVTRQTLYEISYYESCVIPELTELSFPESGMIEELPVYIGMEVKKGDRLGTLAGASKEYEKQEEYCDSLTAGHEYENALTELQLEHARLENSLFDADNNVERQQLVYEQQKELQELDEAYAGECLETIQSHLSDAYLCAATDGVVAAMADIREGSYVSEDAPVLSIANSDTQYVKCEYISQTSIDRCDRVYAMIGDREYELEYIPIDQTELSAIRMKEETAYSTFKVLDGDENLVGKYAVICLIKNRKENVTAVPITALFSDSDGEYVYRMSGESRTRVNVDTGVKGAHYAQIKEGLSEGDVVYVQESAIPNYSNTVKLEYQDFTVSSSVGVSVYYPVQTAISYMSEYGSAVFAEWLVLTGDDVEKGQPLMNIRIPVDEIAITELKLKEARLKQEKEDLEAKNNAAIEEKEAEIDAAEEEYKTLLQNELEQMKLESERSISSAKKSLEDVKKQLEIAYSAQSTTQITAPCDGTVMYLESYRKDDVIAPDAIVGWLYNTDEALYNFADKSNVMRYGQNVSLLDMRGTEFSGIMVSCNALGTSESLLNKDVFLRCLDEIEAEKRYGLEVEYDVIDLEHVLVVPAEALHSDTFGTYVVEVIDNCTRRRYFTPGKMVNGNCLVIDGLEAGMELVTE